MLMLEQRHDSLIQEMVSANGLLDDVHALVEILQTSHWLGFKTVIRWLKAGRKFLTSIGPSLADPLPFAS
jgi:hypothetical protein